MALRVGLTDIHIAGYRSIRSIRFPVRRLSVLVGENGVGKTNLYRALDLLQGAARGTLARDIAGEGGLGSVFWAGEKKQHEKARLVLEARLDDLSPEAEAFATTYRIEIGFPPLEATAAFPLQAQVKRESITTRARGRTVSLMERDGPSAWGRDGSGKRITAADGLLASETALAVLGGFPETDIVRHALSSWRFYHGFRTDAASLLRQPGLAVTAPMLDPDGSNLAEVFATLHHIRGDTVDLDEAIDLAFPGARLDVPMPGDRSEFTVTFADLPKRAFGVRELSDGTLQFLALMGALLSYRLPPFIALNEPETSLHPSLLPALARIIGKAAARTQIWVVTHSTALADAITVETGVEPHHVVRRDGGTWLEGLSPLGTFEAD